MAIMVLFQIFLLFFTGKCTVDKLKAGLIYLTKELVEIKERMNSFSTCAEKLKYMIISPGEDNLNFKEFFSARDECVKASDCKLKFWMYQMEAKKVLIEKEIKFEDEGFGSSAFMCEY